MVDLDNLDWNLLPLAARRRALDLLQAKRDQAAQRLFFEIYPDEDRIWTGPPLMGGLIQPGQTLHARSKYPKHMEFLAASRDYRETCFMAANRVGKALVHGTKVATPRGWMPIEGVAVGDKVIAGDGSTTRVSGVYPQGEVDLYALSFDGVHEIVTCGEHLWRYQHPRARFPYRQSHGRREPNPFYGDWGVATTRALMRFGVGPRMRAVIPMTSPFALTTEAALPLDPYVLGVLLGDGCLTGTASVTISSADATILDAVRTAFELRYASGYDWRVIGAKPVLRALGLLGTNSTTKFVPAEYLYADPETRLGVLQGLMDSDGSIGLGNAAMEFSTCSDRLADDFEWLAASLGMKALRERRHTKAQNGNGLPSWRIKLRSGRVCPFRLPRKAQRWRPLRETGWLLHGIREAGRGLATCIAVEHESRTFVLEHGIVTHNTFSGGGYAMACHLTGLYPPWWEGRRFERPISAWVAGDTYETTRDIIQLTLLGEIAYRNGRKVVDGRGIIPGYLLGRNTWRSGVQDLIDTIVVRHVTGGHSFLGLKSYDQGRKAFQGVGRHVILFDEEPPMDVYNEALIRTATTNGIIMLTFTPLSGMSDVVLSFMPADQRPDLAA